jgi:thiol:disulfide interchange protein DsbC
MSYSRFRALALALLTGGALVACGGDKASSPATTTDGGKDAAPAAAAQAQAPLYAENDGKAKEVATRVKEKYPNLTATEVRQLNVSGKTAMFEFMAGQQITYTNEDVDFLLVGGELISGAGESATNLTQKSAGIRLKDAYKAIPMEGTIQYSYGNGQREVVIFSDPDCPFCQALEHMIEANKDNLNARIAIVPYPIDSLHPNADKKSRYILCTADPAKSWRSWMITAANSVMNAPQAAVGAQADPWAAWAAQNPSKEGCERAGLVDRAKEYGKTYGFNQTPTLMFTNGMPYLGLPTREELEKAWEYIRNNPAPAQ